MIEFIRILTYLRANIEFAAEAVSVAVRLAKQHGAIIAADIIAAAERDDLYTFVALFEDGAELRFLEFRPWEVQSAEPASMKELVKLALRFAS